MPCSCTDGACTTCLCGRAGALCSAACHGGKASRCCLNFAEARAAAAMPLGEVRKQLARAGIDVIGNKPELVKRLADHLLSLKQQAAAAAADPPAGAAGDAAAAGGAAAGGRGPASAAEAIKRVLAAPDDCAAILRLSGLDVSSTTEPALLRKAYMKLSLLLHPDKNAGSADARAAFQALVSAYERLASGEVAAEEEASKGKSTAGRAGAGGAGEPARTRVGTRVARTNEGCFKTKVCCPRCKMEWGLPELGLEDAAYNFFMQAIKQYHCGRCACLFGPFTALHACPHCRKPFEYDPSMYHERVTCGSCSRPFGFMQYAVTERREKEVRAEVRVEAEARMKRAEAAARRAARSSRRDDDAGAGGGGAGGGGAGGAARQQQSQEQLFALGLLDACPRCGWACGPDDGEEAAAAHLRGCSDAAAIRAHAERKAKVEGAAAAKAAAAAGAEAAAAVQQWNFRGRQVGQLWLLPHSAIVLLLQREGLPMALEPAAGAGADGPGRNALPEDEKPWLIQRLATHFRAAAAAAARAAKGGGPLLLTDGRGGSLGGAGGRGAAPAAAVDAAGLAQVDDDELPSNLHSLEASQLRSVAASYGLPFSGRDTKTALIDRLEKARFKGNRDVLLILDGASPPAGAGKRGRIAGGAGGGGGAAAKGKAGGGGAAAAKKPPRKKAAAKRKRRAGSDSEGEDDDSDWAEEED